MITNMIKLTPTPTHLTNETCPLFCDARGRSREYRDALRTVKRIAKLLPGGESKYGAHSLRIGGTTAAAACKDIDSLALQIMGLWSRDTSMQLYTKNTKEQLHKIARQMAKLHNLVPLRGSRRRSTTTRSRQHKRYQFGGAQ